MKQSSISTLLREKKYRNTHRWMVGLTTKWYLLNLSRETHTHDDKKRKIYQEAKLDGLRHALYSSPPCYQRMWHLRRIGPVFWEGGAFGKTRVVSPWGTGIWVICTVAVENGANTLTTTSLRRVFHYNGKGECFTTDMALNNNGHWVWRTNILLALRLTPLLEHVSETRFSIMSKKSCSGCNMAHTGVLQHKALSKDNIWGWIHSFS